MSFHCDCEQCYFAGFGDGRYCEITKNLERELKILETKRLIAYCRMMAEQERKKKEEEQERKKKEEEQQRKKKRFYNFLFYASLLFILVLKLKWDINNYLNPNLFL